MLAASLAYMTLLDDIAGKTIPKIEGFTQDQKKTSAKEDRLSGTVHIITKTLRLMMKNKLLIFEKAWSLIAPKKLRAPGH